MDYRVALGVIATVMALISYVPYIRDMVAGRTKPHAFTWLVWASLTAIAFAGQISDGAGPGAWVTGFTATVSFAIFAVALRHGEKDIAPMDWISLAGAGSGLLLWAITDQPLLAVVLITLIDARIRAHVPQIVPAPIRGNRRDVRTEQPQIRRGDSGVGEPVLGDVAVSSVAGAHERTLRRHGAHAPTPAHRPAGGMTVPIDDLLPLFRLSPRHWSPRIGDPLRPRSDIQPGSDARELQRQHLVRRGDAGSAVRAHVPGARHPQLGEPCP